MKSNKGKFLAQVGFYALFLGLLFYAASRTLHFVQATMPTDQQYWGYLFLLATGVGAVIWLYVFLNLAEGAKQRGIAFAMGIIDLIGEAILVYADTVRVAGSNGLMTFNDQETRTFVIVSVGVIILNIFAAYMFKLYDPQAERTGMARDLTDDISAAAFKHLQTPEAKEEMIGQLKPLLMESILRGVNSEVMEMIGKMGNTQQPPQVYAATTQQPPTLPSLTTTKPAVDQQAQPISDEYKKMYRPGTVFNDGTSLPVGWTCGNCGTDNHVGVGFCARCSLTQDEAASVAKRRSTQADQPRKEELPVQGNAPFRG